MENDSSQARMSVGWRSGLRASALMCLLQVLQSHVRSSATRRPTETPAWRCSGDLRLSQTLAPVDHQRQPGDKCRAI